MKVRRKRRVAMAANNEPGLAKLGLPATGSYEKFHESFMAHVKLHIPGPIEVSEKTFKAFCSPMIGHRGQGFKDLYAKIQPQLQQLLYTKQLVYISTSSAWGVMEGAIRNLVSKKVLNCMNGAFSDKWFDVSKRCGKDAEALQVPWGSPIRAEAVDKKLATGQFDALTVIHTLVIVISRPPATSSSNADKCAFAERTLMISPMPGARETSLSIIGGDFAMVYFAVFVFTASL